MPTGEKISGEGRQTPRLAAGGFPHPGRQGCLGSGQEEGPPDTQSPDYSADKDGRQKPTEGQLFRILPKIKPPKKEKDLPLKKMFQRMHRRLYKLLPEKRPQISEQKWPLSDQYPGQGRAPAWRPI